jgi:hypothetical protein
MGRPGDWNGQAIFQERLNVHLDGLTDVLESVALRPSLRNAPR